MKQTNYKSIIYFIGATIAATIAIQLYWNIQNYRINKKRLINEVQISLDNSVERYYSDLAKTDIFTFVNERSRSGMTLDHSYNPSWNHFDKDSLFLEFKIDYDSIDFGSEIKGITKLLDSSKAFTSMKSGEITMMSVFQGKNAIDSIQKLTDLTKRIVVSITHDTIKFAKLDTLFKNELQRKGLAISYNLKHLDNDLIIGSFKGDVDEIFELSTFSKSTYLPESQKLQLFFSNPTLAILKRSLTGIILSFLLSGCIVACLLYLLNIINKQKELAEIKNDLISNITHEFKTPIATAFTAIEGIKSFNEANDREKTQTYLELSNQQLHKLNHMVEKLLETATLDSDKLLLKKEEVDLVFFLQQLVENHLLTTDKIIKFKANVASVTANVDVFHFENAVGNLLDNAIKYGGDTIEMNLNSVLSIIEISVADNGGGIDKNQRDKIFDKFYRVPTGNRHDVKGFGIGLFYTKKIIEKHEASIEMIPNTEDTIFKITL